MECEDAYFGNRNGQCQPIAYLSMASISSFPKIIGHHSLKILSGVIADKYGHRQSRPPRAAHNRPSEHSNPYSNVQIRFYSSRFVFRILRREWRHILNPSRLWSAATTVRTRERRNRIYTEAKNQARHQLKVAFQYSESNHAVARKSAAGTYFDKSMLPKWRSLIDGLHENRE